MLEFFGLWLVVIVVVTILFIPHKKYRTSSYYYIFHLFCGYKREYEGITYEEKKEECKRLYKEDMKDIVKNHKKIITDTHRLFIEFFIEAICNEYGIEFCKEYYNFRNKKKSEFTIVSKNKIATIKIKKLKSQINSLASCTLPDNPTKEELNASHRKMEYYHLIIKTKNLNN